MLSKQDFFAIFDNKFFGGMFQPDIDAFFNKFGSDGF
jgi:hypothetical protein